MRKLLYFILLGTCYLQSSGQDTLFYKTIKKNRQYFIEISGETAMVYKMGVYYDKASSGPAILKTELLEKNNQNEFTGNTYSLIKDYNNYILKTEKSKKLNTDIADKRCVHLTLNNAYYLKSYFDLCERINKEFPLNHYSFRNGYSAWDSLDEKNCNPQEFRINTSRQLQKIYDSISIIQTRLSETTAFIIENSKVLSYTILKDSLKTLPVNYRSQSAYFDKSVYQMAKMNPEYFYKLLLDFSGNKDIIYFTVQQDKELVKQLKKVQGYDDLKKEFFKDYRNGKSMPYKSLGIYLIFGALITWLITTQP